MHSTKVKIWIKFILVVAKFYMRSHEVTFHNGNYTHRERLREKAKKLEGKLLS